MTKFRVNDHVRVIARSRYFDQVGTVIQIQADQYCSFAVEGIAPVPLWFYPDELVLAEWPTTTTKGSQS